MIRKLSLIRRFAYIRVFASVASLLVPFAASAYNPNPPPNPVPPAPINNLSDASAFTCGILNWTFYFLMILSVLFIMFAAYRYLTAGGEPEAVKTANKMLLYAAVAVAVGILAKTIPVLVGTLFITGFTGAC
ncbi:MAG: hypothetical protein Q7S28_01475 [bacterium]|nr:hypothetical protein [bacterium]